MLIDGVETSQGQICGQPVENLPEPLRGAGFPIPPAQANPMSYLACGLDNAHGRNASMQRMHMSTQPMQEHAGTRVVDTNVHHANAHMRRPAHAPAFVGNLRRRISVG
ncbi:hypothetical protein XaFJ1_GM001125 [Xanthomonas albilineans]|nr:hypothetical protein XaFJ1_GM001125 [Xanthomonas albilineans]